MTANLRKPLSRWLIGVFACGVLATAVCYASDDPAPNTLTDKEKADGWKLLFDGKTTAGWHAVKKDRAPDGWQAIDGALVRVKGGGDIVSDGDFENFELAFDWKVTEGANSGVFFRVNEDYGVIQSPEYQVLDNHKHADGRNPKTSAASNYALHAPTKDLTKPVGEWNQSRIVVNGNHVEHWLNGEKVVTYELDSDEWKSLVAGSKFKEMEYYGKSRRGHIALQDHGDRVEYRNIKIRTLPAKG